MPLMFHRKPRSPTLPRVRGAPPALCTHTGELSCLGVKVLMCSHPNTSSPVPLTVVHDLRAAEIRVKVGSHDVKDLCAYLGEICARILANWEDLEVRSEKSSPPSKLHIAGKTPATESIHAQTSEVDGKPAIFVVGRMLRILVNLSFLFDTDQHPEHVR